MPSPPNAVFIARQRSFPLDLGAADRLRVLLSLPSLSAGQSAVLSPSLAGGEPPASSFKAAISLMVLNQKSAGAFN
jgi:hypothetical protein